MKKEKMSNTLDCGHSISDLIEGPHGKPVCHACSMADLKRVNEGPLGQLVDSRAPKNPAPWPDPTPEMLASPQFEAVWQRIKTWDINVPEVDGEGMYSGANGNHVRAILDALLAGTDQKCGECGGPFYPGIEGVGRKPV